MTHLVLEGVAVEYASARGAVEAVRELSCTLARAQIGCLLGPSGSGKSTVLRAIAGFVPVRAGRISLGGAVISSPSELVPPERRRVGMMPQDLALFPHLDVRGNVGFGLRKLDRDERERRVVELIERVGLAGYADRHPHELSGGQEQRVALARALAPLPELLLLDEPFSSLDGELKERLAIEIRALLKDRAQTAIVVTHSPAEAELMADVIGVMRDGRLVDWRAHAAG